MKQFLMPIFAVLSVGCRRDDNVAGGPCAYTTSYHPAKVIAWSPTADSAQLDLVFEVKNGEAADTFSFHELNNQYLSTEAASAAGVAIGTVFTLAEDHITSGACTPQIRRLELKPFGGKAR